MHIITEDNVEFLDQIEFKARKITIVSDGFKMPKGGASHNRSRIIAKGNAYCYENKVYKPL
ncbi:MAG: hypothetical protein KAJ24_07520 [Candidatus Aenigmarchaeota archaeon]|nr:hypothetical protein [Candidatus Aenigmarchaeota archaeon]